MPCATVTNFSRRIRHGRANGMERQEVQALPREQQPIRSALLASVEAQRRHRVPSSRRLGASSRPDPGRLSRPSRRRRHWKQRDRKPRVPLASAAPWRAPRVERRAQASATRAPRQNQGRDEGMASQRTWSRSSSQGWSDGLRVFRSKPKTLRSVRRRFLSSKDRQLRSLLLQRLQVCFQEGVRRRQRGANLHRVLDSVQRQQVLRREDLFPLVWWPCERPDDARRCTT